MWHPYASADNSLPPYPVASASGVRLKLADNRELIDGMSSWWAAIHGYCNPVLDGAIEAQLSSMSHVMFGGLTNAPAVELAELLAQISPDGLERVFLCDSGSVAVEVAIKMAIQYWQGLNRPAKQRCLSLGNGYHGDTFMAMSVCDPITGMHHLFSDSLHAQYFAPSPACRFGESCTDQDIAVFSQLLEQHSEELAAVILEPIVQGAGGMKFYSAEYLARVRQLCDQHEVLLIADEIATGFGRSGKLFACEHAGISPDILCVGKALTGGYLSLAATLSSNQVAEGICASEAGVFMHGPTFMGNPLACAVACASIRHLLSQPWQSTVQGIEHQLRLLLDPAQKLETVSEVRALGAIGVIEMERPVNMAVLQPALVESGIWLRPFGKLVYMMPPYIISEQDLETLVCTAIAVLKDLGDRALA